MGASAAADFRLVGSLSRLKPRGRFDRVETKRRDMVSTRGRARSSLLQAPDGRLSAEPLDAESPQFYACIGLQGRGSAGSRRRGFVGGHASVRRELASGMKRTRHQRVPSVRRRALQIIAANPDGCTEVTRALHLMNPVGAERGLGGWGREAGLNKARPVSGQALTQTLDRHVANLGSQSQELKRKPAVGEPMISRFLSRHVLKKFWIKLTARLRAPDSQHATRPAARQRPRPDAEIVRWGSFIVASPSPGASFDDLVGARERLRHDEAVSASARAASRASS